MSAAETQKVKISVANPTALGLFGLAMVLIMVWRPGGLLSHREPTLKAPSSFIRQSKREAA